MPNPKEQQTQGNTLQTEQGIVVSSPGPLPNKLVESRKKMYRICLLCVGGIIFAKIGQGIPVLSGFFSMLLIACFAIPVVILVLMEGSARTAEADLRKLVFKFTNNVDSESLVATISPILLKTHNMPVKMGKDGAVTIVAGRCSYDIHIRDDASFTVYWWMSVGNAVFMMREYKAYCTMLQAMGIIVYEIQKAYGIQEQVGGMAGYCEGDTKTENNANAAKFCGQCGSELMSGTQFCPRCGAAVR